MAKTFEELANEAAAQAAPTDTAGGGQPQGPAQDPSWWQRNVTGEGMSDSGVTEQRPWAPPGTSLGSKLAVGLAPLYTSDADEVANLFVKHYGGEKIKDPVAAQRGIDHPLVRMPNGYTFDPNKLGMSAADVKSFAAQGVLGAVVNRFLPKGSGGALWQAGTAGLEQMGLQAGMTGVGAAAGTGISKEKAASDIVFAGMGGAAGGAVGGAVTGRLGPLMDWAGTQLNKALGRVDASAASRAASNEQLIDDLMEQSGLGSWKDIPIAKRREVLGDITNKSPDAIRQALSEPERARALYTYTTGKEFGENLSQATASGNIEKLAKEAQIAQRAPGSALAQSYETQGQGIGGLLEREAVPVKTAGEALQKGMQQVPVEAANAEQAAWRDLRANYGTQRLTKSSEGTLSQVINKQFINEFPTRANAPNASKLYDDAQALAAGSPRGVRLNDILDQRDEVVKQIANLNPNNPKAKTELKYLEKLRDTYDSFLIKGRSGQTFDATQSALDASKKAGSLKMPRAAPHDEVGTVLDNLMHKQDQDPVEAFKSVADSYKGDEIIQRVRNDLPPAEADRVLEDLKGGMIESIIKGDAKSVADLSAKALRSKLDQLTDHRVAKNLFSPDELRAFERRKFVLDNIIKRGGASDAVQKVIDGLGKDVPGWEKAFRWGVRGALKEAGGAGLGFVLTGGSPIGAATGLAIPPAIAGTRNMLARGAAREAMRPPAITPPYRSPTAVGAGVGGATGARLAQPTFDVLSGFPGGFGGLGPQPANAAGLLNQEPLAVQSRGLMD